MLPPIRQGEFGSRKVFGRVEAEVFDKELSLRPDCIGYTENETLMWIEFKRTHEVDVKKAGKIISAKIDCVEIDLNSCELDPIKVRSFIEGSSEQRKWIYNHEHPYSFQINEKKADIQYTDFDDDYEFERRISCIVHIVNERTWK